MIISRNELYCQPISINLYKSFDFLIKDFSAIKDIFSNNIDEVLMKYGSIFQIDIEKLVKGTTYNVSNRNELYNLLVEDLNLILFKGIVTSRLCVIFYRLTYFDLDASKASIGRFFANHFEKSESFKINLNRNLDGYFFTDLNNKIFRGYKIKNKSSFYKTREEDIFDEKIKIARRLRSSGVKMKIVAEAIDMPEDELKDIIYKQTESLPSYPNNKFNFSNLNTTLNLTNSNRRNIYNYRN